MSAYDILCIILCIFAVFGGYIALRLAARAALLRVLRSNERRRAASTCKDCERREGCDCREGCPRAGRGDCPENGTVGADAPKKD